jgi:hypothetical protein
VQEGVIGGGQHPARERAQLGEDVPDFVCHPIRTVRTDGRCGAGGTGRTDRRARSEKTNAHECAKING